ncbi:hypothetical protein [Shinella zoogloeoides]|uniref:hypothetical protein n=1 Tax=Shinella zoogloeoides TaxID=352475 RepID=UPI001F5AA085|nr:hypothetical protein [Shinella zoogloeoides]
MVKAMVVLPNDRRWAFTLFSRRVDKPYRALSLCCIVLAGESHYLNGDRTIDEQSGDFG